MHGMKKKQCRVVTLWTPPQNPVRIKQNGCPFLTSLSFLGLLPHDGRSCSPRRESNIPYSHLPVKSGSPPPVLRKSCRNLQGKKRRMCILHGKLPILANHFSSSDPTPLWQIMDRSSANHPEEATLTKWSLPFRITYTRYIPGSVWCFIMAQKRRRIHSTNRAMWTSIRCHRKKLGPTWIQTSLTTKPALMESRALLPSISKASTATTILSSDFLLHGSTRN